MVSGAEMIERPEIGYDSVAGLDEQKQSVREAIGTAAELARVVQKSRSRTSKSVLLVGPPGCGKPYLG